MGVFDTAAKKIINLLGMTTLGQKTKATALGVTLASDEDAIGVTDNSGSLTVDSPGIPTSIGQKTKATALGVTLASDEDALSVDDGAGSLTVDSPQLPASLGAKPIAGSLSVTLDNENYLNPIYMHIPSGDDITEGSTSDAAIITDSMGSLSGKMRGLVKWAFERMPASLGQKTKAASLSVALASDQGSIEVDSPQLPASLGQKISSASLAVVLPSDMNAIPVSMNGEVTGVTVPLARYDYGAVYGNLTDGDLIDGKTYDWYAIRSANDGGPTDTLTTDANVAKYFQGGHASMDTTPIWVYIPINATIGSLPNLYGGWRTFSANIKNMLAVNLAITLYAVPTKELFNFGVDKRPIGDAFDFWQIATDTLASGNAKCFGPNGTTLTSGYDMPFGWLVIKAVPATDPSTGYWALAVRRSS